MKSSNNKIDDSVFENYIRNNSYVKIFRNVLGEEENLYGFILAFSKDFLFLQMTNEFMLDGYAIIRRNDFDRIRHSRYEKAHQKIFHAEGVLQSAYGFNKTLPLTGWTSIFRALRQHDIHVIIENFRKDCLDFWIGEITRVNTKSLSIHNYDPGGELDSRPSNIRFDTISIIKFGDRYSTILRKYLKLKSR